MTKLMIVLLIGLLFEAVGVVCLSQGLKQIGEMDKVSISEILRLVKNGVTNHKIILGVFFEAIFFGTQLFCLARGPVSFIWPLTSLGFVLTTLAARWILNEDVSILRWSGVFLIMLGVGVITYSEKVVEQKKKTALVQPTAGNH